jgi:DNA-binding CsgD family transcriptional regulator
LTEDYDNLRKGDNIAPHLTPREIEIVGFISKGATNQEISLALRISVNTVKTHITNILKKLGAKNKTQAVALCFEYGIICGTVCRCRKIF